MAQGNSLEKKKYEKHLKEMLIWMADISKDISELLKRISTGESIENMENELMTFYHLKKKYDNLPTTETNNQ